MHLQTTIQKWLKMIILSDSFENFVGNEGNDGYPHFVLFPRCFKKPFLCRIEWYNSVYLGNYYVYNAMCFIHAMSFSKPYAILNILACGWFPHSIGLEPLHVAVSIFTDRCNPLVVHSPTKKVIFIIKIYIPCANLTVGVEELEGDATTVG